METTVTEYLSFSINFSIAVATFFFGVAAGIGAMSWALRRGSNASSGGAYNAKTR